MKLLALRVVRILLVIYVFFFAYEWWRPMPDVMSKESATYTVPDKDVRFFYDLPSKDKKGKPLQIHDIEDRIAALVAGADQLIIVSNENVPLSGSSTLRSLLDTKHEKDKHSAIALVTDPKSTRYGGVRSETIEDLRRNGTQVIETDLSSMPDGNLLYSSAWRPFFSWWGNSPDGGRFSDPIDPSGKTVPLRSWLAYLNMKSNESHSLVVDATMADKSGKTNTKVVAMVSSSDISSSVASSTNVALEVDDKVGVDLLGKATTVATLSSSGLPVYNLGNIADESGPLSVTVLDVAHQHERILSLLRSLHARDQLDIATRFLSDRDVVGAIKDAAQRNVSVRIILDKNEKIDGHELYGLPNLPVAKELTSGLVEGVTVRWCDQSISPCTSRLLLGKSATSTFLLLGGADLTSRDLGGFNIEEEALVEAPFAFGAYQSAEAYFNKLWTNDGGDYTVDGTTYGDDSLWRSSLYRLMELTGLSYY